jgi:hypothetical protein
MDKLERRFLAASLVVAAALLAAGGLAAQSAGETKKQPPEQQQEQARTPAAQDSGQTPEQSPSESRSAAPARHAGPHVTGTVIRWNGHRIDLKTREGKVQKIAVNPETERLVEIKEGAEVTVDYRRKISDFVIAERVRPVEQAAATAQSGTATAPDRTPTVTGSVVSWNNAALVLRTEAGDVTLFLSPETEYLVESLDPGLQVIVEFQEGAGSARLATRVRAAEQGESSAKKNGRS